VSAPMKEFPLAEVYRLLEPGPVVLVTTARGGRRNVMAMSWYTMMEFEPPLVGCVITGERTVANLRATKECVIAIPTVEIARKVVACGNPHPRVADKFERFGLTPLPASKVGAPLVAECYANLECRLHDARMARKYALYVLRVVKAWVDPKRRRPRTIHHMGRGVFMVAGRTIRLPSKAM